MRKAIKTLISSAAIFIALCLIFTAAACGGTKVTSVELNDSSISLYIGDTYSLEYLVYPQSAADETATWESFPETVAQVDQNGTVTGIGEGTAVVVVTVGDYSAKCTVKVIDKSKESVNETGVSLSQSSLVFDSNESDPVQLTATVTPENATNPSVTWSSGNENIATVDQTGLVTPVAGGNTTITVRTNNLGYNASCAVSVGGEAAESSLYVAQVDSLAGRQREDINDDDYFIMGMDASEVPSIEAARASVENTSEDENYSPYKNFDGEEEDVFQILVDNGITDIRVRIWNDPKDSNGNTYGGGECTVDNAVAIAKRCEAVGLGLIVDFHYSDFWADPGKQTVPKAWKDKSTSEIATAIGDFTKTSLTSIKETGVKITMVQVGNETNQFMCGATDWNTIASYMSAGSAAVREVTGAVADGGAKVALHFTNAASNVWGSYASNLQNYNVDYDVFGVSFYPYYTSHGTLANATSQLASIHNNYGKDVMVLETAYAYSYEDFDGTGNTSLEQITQPVTVQGQSNAVRDVIKGIADLQDSTSGEYYGLGICYWGGTWIGASSSSSGATNNQLSKEFGCGWATANAYDYDNDANNGGSQVDNQTFFDQYGNALDSLHVFDYVFEEGHTTDLAVDYSDVQEVFYTIDEGPIELPAQVSCILNSGKSETKNVTWFIEDEELQSYIHSADTYTVYGTTDYGGTIECTVWVQYPNILDEGSFEGLASYVDDTKGVYSGSGISPWVLTYTNSNSGDLQLYVSSNSTNARMGSQSFHFWDSGTVQFTLEQTVDLSRLTEYGSGNYGCSFEIQGNDADTSTLKIYAYIKVTTSSGTTTYAATENNYAELLGWTNWSRTSVSGVYIDISAVTSIVVGISVYAPAAADTKGPWGNIDNCQFYFEGATA